MRPEPLQGTFMLLRDLFVACIIEVEIGKALCIYYSEFNLESEHKAEPDLSFPYRIQYMVARQVFL
jgi:hypothetical protein